MYFSLEEKKTRVIWKNTRREVSIYMFFFFFKHCFPYLQRWSTRVSLWGRYTHQGPPRRIRDYNTQWLMYETKLLSCLLYWATFVTVYIKKKKREKYIMVCPGASIFFPAAFKNKNTGNLFTLCRSNNI